MAKKIVTTAEALRMLEVRGIQVSYSNLALWVRSGKFNGAKQEETPRGPVWMIPADSVAKFEPPKRGRIPKAKANNAQKQQAETAPNTDGQVVVKQKRMAKKGGKK